MSLFQPLSLRHSSARRSVPFPRTTPAAPTPAQLELTSLQVSLAPAEAAQLAQMAAEEGRPLPELAALLLREALHARRGTAAQLQRWKTLSPREQQVAALICLDLTSRQAAARLHISPETVKTHSEHLLRKFGLRTRTQLRTALSGWDFSAWR